jgi:hypothetical protein
MSPQTEFDTHLRRSGPIFARTIWIIAVSAMMILFSFGLLTSLRQLRTVCTGASCHPAQLDAAQEELNRQLGLSLDFYAWYTTIAFAVFGFVFFAIAWLIFWRRSDDWMALFVSLWMVMIGFGANAVIPALGPLLFVLAGAGIFPLFCLFPDGRFVPGWTRWLVLGWIVYSFINLLIAPPPARGISSSPPGPLSQVAFLVGIGAQIFRYRWSSTPLQRQQTKWAVFGFAGWFVCLVALLLALAFLPALRDPLPDFVLDRYIFAFVGLLPILFIPAGISISILRYRLWDIDLIIRRTLVYSLLTGLLSLLYFSGVALLQGVLTADRGRLTAGEGAVSGPPSAVVIVFTTLLIAALFNPLRRRVQDFIDRRFYRQKYDAEKALAEFADSARSETDLGQLSQRLTGTVQETLQPERVSLWLRTQSRSGGKVS